MKPLAYLLFAIAIGLIAVWILNDSPGWWGWGEVPRDWRERAVEEYYFGDL